MAGIWIPTDSSGGLIAGVCIVVTPCQAPGCTEAVADEWVGDVALCAAHADEFGAYRASRARERLVMACMRDWFRERRGR